MAQFIAAELHRTRISPDIICFEVTETAAIANLGFATSMFSRLQKLGCTFSLDDFGAGLSSFAYLKTLPVNYLKIDGTFVKDIVEDPIDYAMVKSINELGHVVGKTTIAEFVENDAIADKLRELNVDYAQGNGMGRPKPIEALLSTQRRIRD
jgi:EAL domain-containing protein (putative c-di-GMP-specific phosphodiesterase class I)